MNTLTDKQALACYVVV